MRDPRYGDREYDYLERYIIEEMVEDYQEQQIPRREMIRRVLLITGSIPATASILLAMGCGPSATATNTVPAAATTGATTAAATTAAATTAPRAVSPTTGAAATATRPTTPAPGTATRPATATRVATAGGTATRAGSPTPTPNPVTVSPTDPAIEAGPVTFPGQGVTLRGYKSQPRGVAEAPGIIVIHENRGLTEHIKDMTRRYAKDGYLAVAVDLVSRRGGTDGVANPGDIPAILGQQANRAELGQDLLSTVDYVKGLPNFAGPKVGVVGYCFGGGMTWLLATLSEDIGAAVPYYGPPPEPIDDVQKVTAAVLAFYGENDPRITNTLQAVEAAMERYGKTFEYKVYPGAGHAFNNDTGPNFNAAAARDAYQLSLDWFERYVQS